MEREGEGGARVEGSGVGCSSASSSGSSDDVIGSNASSSIAPANYVSIRVAGPVHEAFADGNPCNGSSTRRDFRAGASAPRHSVAASATG